MRSNLSVPGKSGGSPPMHRALRAAVTAPLRSSLAPEREPFTMEGCLMGVLFAIQEDDAGMWCVRRGQLCLSSGLTLAQAIKEARKLARDHHERTGMTASVDLVSAEGSTRLGHYARPSAESDETAAA